MRIYQKQYEYENQFKNVILDWEMGYVRERWERKKMPLSMEKSKNITRLVFPPIVGKKWQIVQKYSVLDIITNNVLILIRNDIAKITWISV